MGEMADDLICGLSCSRCGVYFEEEHGHEVICHFCYDAGTEEDNAGILRATNKEA